MESDLTPQQALAAAERAGAAPYVDYPPTPAWYFPAVGVWAAAMVLAVGELADRPLVFVPVLIALAVAEGVFIGWYRRYRVTMPSMRHVPREIARAMVGFGVGAVIVVIAGVVAATNSFIAAAVTFLAVTAGLIVYEHRYATAARAASERMA